MTDLLAELVEVPISNELQVVRTMPTMLYVFKQLPFRFRGLEFFSGVFSWEKRWKGVVDLNKRNGKVTTKVVVSKQFFECLLLPTWGDFFSNLT